MTASSGTGSSGAGSDPSRLYGDGDRGRSGDSDEEQPRVVIRDKRRIDPETGAVREVPSVPPAGPVPPSAEGSAGAARGGTAVGEGDSDVAAVTVLANELAERTDDLQRVSAEYANYRRRVDRDRVLIGELAQERMVLDLLPVLDDIDRARDHGDLTGAFKSTADQLGTVLDRAGVQAFGAVGDPFDPGVHEAVLHTESAEVSDPTCTHIMRRGYRRGDRVLRAAMVGVADPAAPTGPTPARPIEAIDHPTDESTVDNEASE
ncbi:MAG: nucleotide exchange factor GrpE [Geodermatophilaceae bacterium]|nr:nucleotide exchange factor GrpE [Geodermatophilaceae bacterium]